MNKQYSLLLAAIMILSIITFIEAYAQTVPDKPTDLVGDDVSPTKIDLSWNPPDNDGGSPITGYQIEYRIIPSSTYTTLKDDTNNADTNYSHLNVITDKKYAYRVWAINSEGISEQPSAESNLVTPTDQSAPPEDIPPNAPTNLTALDVSPEEILLSWDKPTANNSPSVTGYKIERKTTGSFEEVKSNTGNTLTSYTDSGFSVPIGGADDCFGEADASFVELLCPTEFNA